MTVDDTRQEAVRYMLYEQTRRKLGREATLPRVSDEQLQELVEQLCGARFHTGARNEVHTNG